MCTICEVRPNPTEAFGEQMIQALNISALAPMISIGHRLGIYDQMSWKRGCTSFELARTMGLNERYVREWLNAMAVGKIVTVDEEMRYSLPAEHAAFLTRAAGADNLAKIFQFIPVMCNVEDQIINCFKNGGGVNYDEFKRFHEVMAEESGSILDSSLFEVILPLIQGIEKKLDEGIKVMDIGCGSGHAINMMAKVFPRSKFTGIDLCLPPLEKAREQSKKLGLSNTHFIHKDLTYFEPDTKYDLITAFDAIHDQARPDIVLRSIYESLADGGTFLAIDINGSSDVRENMDLPLAPLLYSISTMHCMTVSLAQGGMGLGTMWGREKAMEMFADAGFQNVSTHFVADDIQNIYYICKK